MTDQPSPYSNAAVEATVDHLRQRIRELEAQVIEVRQERDELREAVRALFDVLNDDNSNALQPCEECDAVAMRFCTISGQDYCDSHAGPWKPGDLAEYPHAEAWRRLRALVTP